MYFVSSVDKYDVGVTNTVDGVTEFFNRLDLELFLSQGNVVLGAVPCYSERKSVRYSFIPVFLTNSRQVREEVEFSFEGIRNNLVSDTLFDFVRLYNFKSSSNRFCIEFLVLLYLLQVYNDVSILLRNFGMFVSVPFWSYNASSGIHNMSFRLSCDVFHVANLTGGCVKGDTLEISYNRFNDNKKMYIHFNLRTLVVSLSSEGFVEV